MAEVLLFHHVQGLTSGVLEFAAELRRGGHVVHTPDLFHGRTFATIEDGTAHVDTAGLDEIMALGMHSADGLPETLVYAGFSLGVLPAQRLAQHRPGARGALLFHAFVTPEDLGSAWPEGVPVQIHGMAGDPYFAGEGDLAAAEAFVGATASAELFVYPGDGHLFADPTLPDYQPDAATLLQRRALRFLASC